MKDSIKGAIRIIQEVFEDYPDLESVRRIDSLGSLELQTVSNGIKGIQLVAISDANQGSHAG